MDIGKTLICALDLQSSSRLKESSDLLIDSYLIQARANVFRKGYRNWREYAQKQRKGQVVENCKGAGGEITDIASGVVTLVPSDRPSDGVSLADFRSSRADLGGDAHALPGGASAAARKSSPSSGGLGASTVRLSRCNLDEGEGSTNLSFTSQSIAQLSRVDLTTATGKPSAENLLQLANKDLSAAAVDEIENPSDWTKFYITPFTETPIEARKVLPVSDHMLPTLIEQGCRAKLPTYRRYCPNPTIARQYSYQVFCFDRAA